MVASQDETWWGNCYLRWGATPQLAKVWHRRFGRVRGEDASHLRHEPDRLSTKAIFALLYSPANSYPHISNELSSN